MKPLVALLALLALPAWAASPLGTWATEGGGGHVKIEPCGAELCGRIVWLREPNNDQGQPKRDRHNPDPGKREQTIVGMPLLQGFTPDKDKPGEWIGGTIYDPESGKLYKATLMPRADGNLDLRGYVGVPLFGRSQTWTPVR